VLGLALCLDTHCFCFVVLGSCENSLLISSNLHLSKSSDIVDGTKLGFKSYSILNDGWVMIDLDSELYISNIKIQDLTDGDVVTTA
jgi:hypothetical protein